MFTEGITTKPAREHYVALLIAVAHTFYTVGLWLSKTNAAKSPVH